MALSSYSAPTSSASTTTTNSGEKPGALPPGMVMGPDGKPCKICSTSFWKWRPDAPSATAGTTKKTGASKTNSNSKGAAGAVGFASLAAAAAGTVASTDSSTNSTDSANACEHDEMGYRSAQEEDTMTSHADCPPDVEDLGRSTWTFLHTTAAYFPSHPTPLQRASMLSLLRALPVIYPCSWCAKDFGEDLKQNSPDVSSGEKLSEWLCKRHNEVNKKLGKDIFDCAKVAERWKEGPKDGRCD